MRQAILDRLRAENLTHRLDGKNVLVIGGTRGIGSGVAIHFAELGANVAIAGRSAREAERVLDRLRTVTPSSDANNSVAFADKMREKYKSDGLYALVMSQGAATNGAPRKETVEGHEWTLAIAVLSRYIVAAKLIDVLRLGGGAIISIKAGGRFNYFDVDDIELRKFKNVPFLTGSKREAIINDIFAQEISSRTGITFYHLFPGLVKTNPTEDNNVGFPYSFLFKVAFFLAGVSIESYGTMPVHVVLTRPPYVSIQETGKNSPIKSFPKREDVRTKVMAWVEKATGVEISEQV